MNSDSVQGFFYGLYMDPELLQSLGVTVSKSRLACLDNSQLDLRGLIKTIPAPGQKVWGMLIELTKQDLEFLYSREGAKAYHQERVTVSLLEREMVAATCYNLPVDEAGVFNQAYVMKLVPVLKKLSFPEAYVRWVQNLTP